MKYNNNNEFSFTTGVQPSEWKDTPSAYVSGILERLRDVHQRVARTEASTRINPYQPGNLI